MRPWTFCKNFILTLDANVDIGCQWDETAGSTHFCFSDLHVFLHQNKTQNYNIFYSYINLTCKLKEDASNRPTARRKHYTFFTLFCPGTLPFCLPNTFSWFLSCHIKNPKLEKKHTLKSLLQLNIRTILITRMSPLIWVINCFLKLTNIIRQLQYLNRAAFANTKITKFRVLPVFLSVKNKGSLSSPVRSGPSNRK